MYPMIFPILNKATQAAFAGVEQKTLRDILAEIMGVENPTDEELFARMYVFMYSDDGAYSKDMLMNLYSFTEAEARIIEERTPYISGEFTVSAVKKTRIAEIFADPSADDRFYMVKVNFITLDEKSGMEKKSASHILVQANDFASALKRFNDGMNGSAADYEIASIVETPLLDVYNVKATA